MAQESTALLTAISRAIRDRLKESGSSARRFSLVTGRSGGWLADKLNPNREASLTLSNLEEIAAYVGVDSVALLLEALPSADRVEEPRPLLHLLEEQQASKADESVDEEEEKLASEHRRVLDAILSRRLHVSKIDPEIDTEVLETILDSIWKNRTTAFDVGAFHVEELLGRPRKLFTLIAALAILADLVRTLRAPSSEYRLRLLLYAYELLQKYPCPAAEAVVAEKAAYFLWGRLSDFDLCRRLLEQDSLLHHPMPGRLFSARAAFQHIGGNHEIALVELEIAEAFTENPILISCIRGMRGSVLIETEDFEEARQALESTLTEPFLAEAAPVDLQCNNLALLGKAHARAGHKARAVEYLTRALTAEYCARWPDKAGYAALDLEAAEPEAVANVLPRLLQIQNGLLSRHPLESQLKPRIQRMVTAATALSTNALMRRNVDPNG